MSNNIYLSVGILCKNEEDVIERCVNHLNDHVDEIVICDTGSTDNTIEIINNLKNDKIKLVTDYKWNKNFAEARNYVTTHCSGEWILVNDADSILNTNINIKNYLKSLKNNIDVVQVYYLYGSLKYYLPLIYKKKKEIYWKYNFHNVLCFKGCASATCNDIYFIEKKNKKSHAGRKDRQNDLLDYFNKMNIEEPNDTRCWFYCANTYWDNNIFDKAIEKYEGRIKLGGWAEEIYYSLYKIALCKLRLGKNMDEVVYDFLKAHNYRPHRLEALYAVVCHYKNKKDYKKAFAYGMLGYNSRKCNDVLFVNNQVHAYLFDFELSIAAYWVGSYGICKILTEKLLKEKKYASNYEKSLKNNLNFSIKKLEEIKN